ncbi:hypothetical protein GCM10020256_38910 [Streptomyces thermocoprophilus]
MRGRIGAKLSPRPAPGPLTAPRRARFAPVAAQPISSHTAATPHTPPQPRRSKAGPATREARAAPAKPLTTYAVLAAAGVEVVVRARVWLATWEATRAAWIASAAGQRAAMVWPPSPKRGTDTAATRYAHRTTFCAPKRSTRPPASGATAVAARPNRPNRPAVAVDRPYAGPVSSSASDVHSALHAPNMPACRRHARHRSGERRIRPGSDAMPERREAARGRRSEGSTAAVARPRTRVRAAEPAKTHRQPNACPASPPSTRAATMPVNRPAMTAAT